jgi:hypothetical protein
MMKNEQQVFAAEKQARQNAQTHGGGLTRPNAGGGIEDPNRPKGFNSVKIGSDNKAYYYNSQTHTVQLVPEQYQKLYAGVK